MSEDFDDIFDALENDEITDEDVVNSSWLLNLMLCIDPPAKPPLSDEGDQHE